MKLVVNLKTAKASGIAITNSLHASFERHWNSITGRHRYFWIAAYFSTNGVLVTIGPEW